MAGKSTERIEIEELIRISDEARSQLGVTARKLRSTLKAPTKVLGSMKNKPVFWLLGSMAGGLAVSLLLSKLPGRGTKKKGSSLKKAAIALTLSAVRPLAKVWLTNQLKNLSTQWIAARINAQPTRQPVKAASSPFQIEPHPSSENPKPSPLHVRTPGP